MRRSPILILAGVCLVALLALPLYARSLGQPMGGGGPRVIASTSVLADLVRQVGGARLGSVQSVVPPGAEVEDYSPTPANLRSMAQADLLVTNGLQLDSWVPGLVSSARPDIPMLVVSDGMPPDTNPHLWLDVQYAKAYVQKIHDALVAQDPQGAETYDANTAATLRSSTSSTHGSSSRSARCHSSAASWSRSTMRCRTSPRATASTSLA